MAENEPDVPVSGDSPRSEEEVLGSETLAVLKDALKEYSGTATELAYICILLSVLGTLSLAGAVGFAIWVVLNLDPATNGKAGANWFDSSNLGRSIAAAVALLVAASFSKYMVQLLRLGMAEMHRYTDFERSLWRGVIYVRSVNVGTGHWRTLKEAMEPDSPSPIEIIEKIDPGVIDPPFGQIFQIFRKGK
jgi:hypothetical protein